MKSWEEVIDYFENNGENRPFIVDSSLTEGWPILSDESRAWNSLERLSNMFGSQEARIARGSRIGYSDTMGQSPMNPLVATKREIKMLKAMKRMVTETEFSTVRVAIGSLFGLCPRQSDGTTTEDCRDERPLLCRLFNICGEYGSGYIHWHLDDKKWDEMKMLFGESYESCSNIPPIFDDSKFLDCLGPYKDQFNRAFSWHQLLISQPGSGMPFHIDQEYSHFWALQLSGSKTFVFCPQDLGGDLYMGAYDPYNNTDAARARFPRYEAVQDQCYRASVKAGDMLYWESHWWHSTRVFEERGEAVGLPSINIMSCFLGDDIILKSQCRRDNVYGPINTKKPTNSKRKEGIVEEVSPSCAEDCSLCKVPELEVGKSAKGGSEGQDDGEGECGLSPAGCYHENYDPVPPAKGVYKDLSDRVQTCKLQWRKDALERQRAKL
ncbi:hypothetical protein TrST_g10437 [Triparma strigata]|uniref:JmjC domain-containing protein n=1 Tax=Triparma strigata TaxID=1606541 RepID=A0A9W7F3J4_9STRA|nr:hypothetical protein TrST_g10437 [Triparma strigata]